MACSRRTTLELTKKLKTMFKTLEKLVIMGVFLEWLDLRLKMICLAFNLLRKVESALDWLKERTKLMNILH